MSDYYRQKALRAKELYDKGLPFLCTQILIYNFIVI